MTMKRRKVFVGTTVAMVGVAALAGCGGAEAPDVDGEVAGEISYAFWGTPARTEMVQEVIALFESEHPDATVAAESSQYNAYVERLTVRAAGKSMACATGVQDTFLADYATYDVFMPLDDFIQAGVIDSTDIADRIMESGQVNGVQYMMPTGSFVRILGYNAAVLADGGVDAPSPDLTWQQYADWMRAVQATLPPGVYAGENEGGLMFVLQGWVLSHGEQMYADDGTLAFPRELLAEYFEFWLGLAEEGVVLPPDAIAEQYLSLEMRPFATGKAVSASRDIPHLAVSQSALTGVGKPADVVGVSLPSESPDISGNVLGANGISIPTSCDNSATAAQFTDFFTNDTAAAIAFQSDNGIVTSTAAQEALLEDPSTSDSVKQSVAMFRELVAADDIAPVYNPAGASSLTAELRRVYESAAFGSMTVEQAVDAFFAAAENALD